MKKWQITKSNATYLPYAKEIVGLIEPEARAKKMLAWPEEEIRDQISRQDAYLAFVEDELVGYIGLTPWQDYTEISALIVKKEFRQQKIGTLLVNMAVLLAGFNYPGKEIIILPNKVSCKICHKTDFVKKPKDFFAKEIWELCPSCQEYSTFPACHCQPMVYEK